WLGAQHRSGQARASIARRAAGARAFTGFAHRRGGGGTRPGPKVGTPKSRVRAPPERGTAKKGGGSTGEGERGAGDGVASRGGARRGAASDGPGAGQRRAGEGG